MDHNYFPERDVSWVTPLDNQVLIQVAFTEVSALMTYDEAYVKAEQVSNRVGLIKKLGASAYTDKATGEQWANYDVKVGDVILLPEMAIATTFWVDGVLFSLVADVHVKAIVNNPELALSCLKKKY